MYTHDTEADEKIYDDNISKFNQFLESITHHIIGAKAVKTRFSGILNIPDAPMKEKK